jgi:phenylacetic acid degradation operon negative regulatory protein
MVVDKVPKGGSLPAGQAHRESAADQSRLEPVFVVAGRCAPIKIAHGGDMRAARLTLRTKTEVWLHLAAWAAADALIGDGPGIRANMLYGASGRSDSRLQMARLERKLILERQPGGAKDRIYRLTSLGRTLVLGGRDSEAWWARRWDGNWRVLMFDLPADRSTERTNLLRLLRERGYGCLQGSAWISPHPFEKGDDPNSGIVHPQSLFSIVGRPEGGLTDAKLVEAAWNWTEIEKDWRAHEKLLAAAPAKAADRRQLTAWATDEFHSWKHLMKMDPLLPESLWPAGYPGRRIWKARKAALPERFRKILGHEPN